MTEAPTVDPHQDIAKTAGHFQSSTHANYANHYPEFRADELTFHLCFQHRPRPEWRELRSGSGQIRQQLHQPGQPRPGNGFRQVLLPHQGAVCPTEEPGEFIMSALIISLKWIACPTECSCPHVESLFFPVFPSLSGLGFGFKVKIRITLG